MMAIDVPTVGSLLSIRHLKKTGLTGNDDELSILAREDTVRLSAQLNKPRGCLLQGPAGTGKSCTVWYWLLAH